MNLPTNQQELRKALFNNVTMIRPLAHKDTHQWFSPDAHVIAMTASAINSTAAAFDTDYWPELTKLMAQLTDGDPAKLEQAVTNAFPVIHAFLERATDKNAPDLTLLDALNAVGWDKVDTVGKIAYLAMFSNYYLARYWVACRQLLELGATPGALMSRISEAAGEALRQYDQKIDPQEEAMMLIKKATQAAVNAGMSETTFTLAASRAMLDAREQLKS